MIPPVANRFVAGETAAEAIDYARQTEEAGIETILNRLGSHHDAYASARADATAYRRLVEDVVDADLNAAISVKPSQLGLDLGEPVFRELLTDVVDCAADHEVVVWLDMEEHDLVDPTLEAAVDLAREYPGGIGVCVQADLKRTREDLGRLEDAPLHLRLVKGGAYERPEAIAYTDAKRRDRAYRELLTEAFERFDDGLAVATHDPEMLAYARSVGERYDTDFEIQMLMGVRPDAQRDLAEEYDVRQFVPYGRRWKRWALNRARRNLAFTARAVGETVIAAAPRAGRRGRAQDSIRR